MENTIENKAKFFAQYYGQIIIRNHSGFGGKFKVTDLHFQDDEEYYLELTTLSDITDEDCDKIIEILGYKDNEQKSYLIGQLKIFSSAENMFSFLDLYRIEPATILQVIDYLRSRGYALPWMGVSVEEQIKRGWIKLKTK